MRKGLLGSVALLAICAAVPATAGGVSGTLSGSYATSINSGGGDLYGVNGSLLGSFGGNWGGELNGNYHHLSGGSDVWDFGGSLFHNFGSGRLVASAEYHDNLGSHFGSFGAGADWYASSNVTLSIKGGGLAGGGSSGSYAGGQGTWYVMPDLSLSASVDYLDVGINITSETIRGEWLVSETTPVSAYVGYQHEDIGGLSGDLVFVGIKLYTNGGGAATLVDRQRSGALGFSGQSPLFYDNL